MPGSRTTSEEKEVRGTRDGKRSAPRTRYSSTAIVFLASQQYTCRVTNLSVKGALMVSPVHAPRNTFLRINISLPGLDEVLDLDGVVTRETQVKGYYAWGVKFHEPSSEAVALIEAFQKWAARQQARAINEFDRPVTQSRPRPRPTIRTKLPSSAGLKDIQRRVTGPSYPKVTETALKDRGTRRRPTTRAKESVEERWRRREEEQMAKRDLAELYRSAMGEFTRERSTKK